MSLDIPSCRTSGRAVIQDLTASDYSTGHFYADFGPSVWLGTRFKHQRLRYKRFYRRQSLRRSFQ